MYFRISSTKVYFIDSINSYSNKQELHNTTLVYRKRSFSLWSCVINENTRNIPLCVQIDLMQFHFTYGISAINPFFNVLRVYYKIFLCFLFSICLSKCSLFMFFSNIPPSIKDSPFLWNIDTSPSLWQSRLEQRGILMSVQQKQFCHYNPIILQLWKNSCCQMVLLHKPAWNVTEQQDKGGGKKKSLE